MKSDRQINYLCPQCDKKVQLSSQTNQSIATCPHCSQELLLAELETKVNPDKDTVAPEAVASTFPDQLGEDYEIIKEIGRGGMGAVYLANQSSLNREVAVKFLPPEFSQSPQFVRRFHREAKTMGALDHPQIVKVLSQGQEGDFYYFVMEYIEGKSLREAMEEGHLSFGDKCRILIQICQGLQYAHDQGLVHRDIKPGNVLLTSDESIKISDFGLVRLTTSSLPGQGRETLTDLTATNMVVGTLRYMAPEQKSNSSQVDHRADLYALGVIAYELFTGKDPSGRFSLPTEIDPHLPNTLDHFIEKALQPEPSTRYQSAQAMAEDLRKIKKRGKKTALQLEEEEKDEKEASGKESKKSSPSPKKVIFNLLMGSKFGCSVAVTLGLIMIVTTLQFTSQFQQHQKEVATRDNSDSKSKDSQIEDATPAPPAKPWPKQDGKPRPILYVKDVKKKLSQWQKDSPRTMSLLQSPPLRDSEKAREEKHGTSLVERSFRTRTKGEKTVTGGYRSKLTLKEVQAHMKKLEEINGELHRGNWKEGLAALDQFKETYTLPSLQALASVYAGLLHHSRAKSLKGQRAQREFEAARKAYQRAMAFAPQWPLPFCLLLDQLYHQSSFTLEEIELMAHCLYQVAELEPNFQSLAHLQNLRDRLTGKMKTSDTK